MTTTQQKQLRSTHNSNRTQHKYMGKKKSMARNILRRIVNAPIRIKWVSMQQIVFYAAILNFWLLILVLEKREKLLNQKDIE